MESPGERPQVTQIPIPIPILPSNARLEYLGEGAANMVFRISIPTSQGTQTSTPPPTALEDFGDGKPPPSEIESQRGEENVQDLTVFENKLLRVRKDLPTTVPCSDAQEQWSKLILPLFAPSQLVRQSLVSLRTQEYNHITTLNASLQEWEKTSSKSSANKQDNRPTKRQGVYLANDEYGLLVTDMSGPGVFQFKPKWLAQSESAPKGAKRCRQCALYAKKYASQPEDDELIIQHFCPLNLLSEDREVLLEITIAMLFSQAGENVPDARRYSKFMSWLMGSGRKLLKDLRNAQVSRGGSGVLAATPEDEKENLNLRVAMTLRDCTVFVDLTENEGKAKGKEGGKVEARIGDLDVKSPAKLTYWQETEKALIEGGWYTGTEAGVKVENECALSCEPAKSIISEMRKGKQRSSRD